MIPKDPIVVLARPRSFVLENILINPRTRTSGMDEDEYCL